MSKYTNLASFIIQEVGGAENIVSITHCMTRLRIKLKDNNKANKEQLESNNEIISTQEAEGKLQVIIGTHVGDVYEEIIRQTGDHDLEEEEVEEKGSLINRFAATITKIVVPTLGVLGACGIIAGLNSVLLATGVITQDSGTYLLLNAMGNACLTFFPVILGYTSAVAFGMNPFTGMILGAILIFPGIADSMNDGQPLFSIFAQTPFEMAVHKTFFNIPIVFPAMGYTSTLIPIMLVNLAAAKLEKFLNKIMPAVTRQFMIPFITILIAGVLGVLLIGPLSMILQNGLQAILTWLISVSEILAFAVITLIYQPLVIFGLHWPLITLGLMEFAAGGSSLIIAAIFPASFTHMASCLAVFLKTRSTKMKNIALPAFLSACFCIIEPSIYGVTLPVKKRFAYCMAGGLVGGSILILAHSPMYSVSMGVTGFMSFISPVTGDFMGLVWCVIACIAAMAVTFSLTWFTYRPGEDGRNEDDVLTVADKANQSEIIASPMKGKVQALSSMKDVAFSKEGMGKGVCILPEEGKIVSPFDGTIEVLYPTGHAIGLKSNQGAQLLIHVGMDTYKLKEGLFKKYKEQGMKIKKGETLISFDMSTLQKMEYCLETAVILSNSNQYLDVIQTNNSQVNYLDELMTTIDLKQVDKG